MKDLLAICTPLLLALSISPSNAADLDLNIFGATPASGQFLISVFSGEANWMKRPVKNTTISVAGNGSASIRFDLPPGSYGVAVVHDANADGQINVNKMGIPTEAFGFSNNAKALFGPPKFKHASFEITMNGRAMEIRLGRAQ